jgi:hypothetical protein
MATSTKIEPEPVIAAPPQPSRRIHPVAIFVLGILLGFFMLSASDLVNRPSIWNRLGGFITHRTTSIDLSSPSVVEKVRQLSRLETVDYSLDKIVSGERGNPYIPDFLIGDKLLLIAHGEVIAGVDLSQLKPGDVTVSGNSVRVQLPQPQILTTRIDNARTRIYSRSTGLLVAPDPNLESQVRQAAEQQIGQAALDDGILLKARQNARTSVAALLSGLGFHSVDVE